MSLRHRIFNQFGNLALKPKAITTMIVFYKGFVYEERLLSKIRYLKDIGFLAKNAPRPFTSF